MLRTILVSYVLYTSRFYRQVPEPTPTSCQLPKARVVALPHEFALVPCTEDLIYEFEPDSFIEPFWFLPAKLFALAVNFSAIGPLGYFELDILGGIGNGNAVLWHDKQVVFGPATSVKTAATEQLFKQLGVPTTWTHAGFDALGLGRHRHIEDWLDH